jgi:predicted nucleic acid-binding protein
MSDVEFCDTNVLLYAHDSTAPPEKRDRAQSLLTALWASRRGCLSTQVLQEFYVNVVRVTHDAVRARDIVQQYLQWPIMIVEPPDLLRAMEQAERYRLSFWDALIVTAAQKAQASVLWTEDLNAGQRMGDVVIRNPFMPMG